MRMRREERKNQEYKKGLWTLEEDNILKDYVLTYGSGQWNRIFRKTGLKRCGKSCRLRWMNYLSPNVNKSTFTEQEEDLIVRLHKLLGNRWSLIAKRVPGRTDNQVKNYWNSHLSKKIVGDHTSVVKPTGEEETTPSLFITTATTSSRHHPPESICNNEKFVDGYVAASYENIPKLTDLTQNDVEATSKALWLQDEDFEMSSLLMMDFASCDIAYAL